MKRYLSVLMMICLAAVTCFPTLGCSSSTVDQVLADLPIAVDIATSLVTIVDPGAGQAIFSSGKAAAGLKLLESLVTDLKENISPTATVLEQINAGIIGVQNNLADVLSLVGVKNPRITAGVAAAVGSIRLILAKLILLVQAHAPQAASRALAGVSIDPQEQRPADLGKSARQIAQEYNQKISKDFPAARVNVPGVKVLGVKVPLTGGK